MIPPRQQLTWDQIVEYAFLADFDLLRDTRQDIRLRQWAQPAVRVLVDQYFRLERAREEIKRLNIEIRRIITHIHDEQAYLRQAEVACSDPVLAVHIAGYRGERTRYSALHLHRFAVLARHPGFTGTLAPGVALDKTTAVERSSSLAPDTPRTSTEVQALGDPDDDVAAGGVDEDGGSDHEDWDLEARVSILEAVL